MLIRVMLHQLIQLVYWDNHNNVEHAVRLGNLSNPILSCTVAGNDETGEEKNA